MKLSASNIELSLSRATGKSPLMLRAYTVRMLVELINKKPLTRKQYKKLGYKALNSFPRLHEKGDRRTLYIAEHPEENHKTFTQIICMAQELLEEVN